MEEEYIDELESDNSVNIPQQNNYNFSNKLQKNNFVNRFNNRKGNKAQTAELNDKKNEARTNFVNAKKDYRKQKNAAKFSNDNHNLEKAKLNKKNAKTEYNKTKSNLKTDRLNKLKAANYARKNPLEATKALVKNKLKNTLKSFIMKNPTVVIFLVSGIFILFLLLITAMGLLNGKQHSSAQSANLNGSGYVMVDSEGNVIEGNILEFIARWEGGLHLCTTSSGKPGYKAYDGADGTITVGSGLSNHFFSGTDTAKYIISNNLTEDLRKSGSTFYVNEGDCVNKNNLEKLFIFAGEDKYRKPLINAMSKYNVKLEKHQIDALTSFNYQHGAGDSELLIKKYKEEGYEGLWSFFLKYDGADNKPGVKKRRKGEFALFVTGDYTDRGLFDSRTLPIPNYEYYDSEGVMAREAKKVYHGNYSDGNDEFMFPLEINPDSKPLCTSPKSPKRVNPIDGKVYSHDGLDLDASPPPNVLAAKSGKVLRTKKSCVYKSKNGRDPGCNVVIDHGDGMETKYYHLKKGTVTVSAGDNVEQGQILGIMGATGTSTGEHLHFEILKNGIPVDPYDYLDLKSIVTSGSYHNCKYHGK